MVIAAAGWFGFRPLLSNFAAATRRPPASFFSPEFLKQVSTVTRSVSPGAPLLHFGGWVSAYLWQRALYPRNAVKLLLPEDAVPATIRQARDDFGANYAISVGDPPTDPGFLWHRVLDPVPGGGETWFGKLAP
jgi:hypothetical protein